MILVRRSFDVASFSASVLVLVLVLALVPAVAHAEEPPPHEDEAKTIPVVVEAGSQIVAVDREVCRRDRCEMRVAPGRHTVSIQVNKNGEFVDDYTESVTIDGPTVINASGPGLLHRIALITTVAGGAIVIAGAVIPLAVCRTDYVPDPVTGRVIDRDPCRDLSDGVKVAWIAGIGVGLTLVLLGVIGLAGTPSPRVKVRPWALLPFVAPVAREDGKIMPSFGFGLTQSF